uniref:Uncharacterized protein n=1 Tax=Emiliania huxleyi (strain CCMP1516) TaxID=280463 RepID=A0A0D3JMA7_EMIH1
MSAPPPPSPPPGRRRPRRTIRRAARPTGRRRSDSVDGRPSAWLVPSRPAGDAHSLLG